jgi:hypothetical protein
MQSQSKWVHRLGGWAAAFSILIGFMPPPAALRIGTSQVTLSTYRVREGTDYATLDLGDPWDMNEYSDVSMYLNESSVAIHLQNLSVSGGVFSAGSVGTDAQFHVLFPGYQLAIPAGKTGARFPIASAQYHCLFARMDVASAEALDEVRVWWFADSRLTGGPFGSGRLSSFPFQQGWKLYGVDLNDPIFHDTGAVWTGVSAWQGLRLDPTTKASVNFSVDWVRLTDCSQVPITISWTEAGGPVELWAGISQPQQDFLIPGGPLSKPSCGSNSCSVDVQGWEPGVYYLGVKVGAGSVQWSSQPLIVDAAPRISFERPSYTSGQSLRWDMNGPTDIVTAFTRCVNYSFGGGTMDLVTLPPSQLPGSCVSSGSSDPQIMLAMIAGDIDPKVFRYLTLRVHMDESWQWQDVNRGWMIRWIWSPGGSPFYVSADIAFDVGWQALTIDLHDPAEGTPEYCDSVQGPCPVVAWKDLSTVHLLRLDPNENTTSAAFHQFLDFVSLSRMDRIQQGSYFPIQINSSEAIPGLVLSFFYTSDRSSPTQHAVVLAGSPPPPAGPYRLYLPVLLNGQGGTPDNSFLWDTSSVAAGVYYICVQAADGVNTVLSCSQAPVEVWTS